MSEAAADATPKAHEHVEVPVRTPAGVTHRFRLHLDELVAEVIFVAIRYFVERNELAAGDYGLAVIRDGQAESMTDTNRLEDHGITDADVLQLVPEAPQVDG